MVRQHVAAAMLVGLLGASSAQAASVSFFLDQSNRLPDGVNYLQVTIADGAAGAIDFTVTALQPLLDIAGNNFGIQDFAFNVVGGTGAARRNVTDLPSRWRARNGGRMPGFGLYDMTVSGNARTRQESLSFSITGVNLDTVLSYVDLSTGRSPEGFSLFSAQVFGLASGNCNTRRGPCVRQAHFGGNIAAVEAVPAPPAIWLLGTAVAALAARRLRRA